MATFGTSLMGIKVVSKEWEDWIKETHAKLKKRKDTNAKVTAYIGKWIQENFKSQGRKAIGGSGWKPLSELTIAMRGKGIGSGSPQILVDIGDLKNRWKRFYTDQDAFIESGVDYGWKHEHGDRHNTWMGFPAPIPQRKILPIKNQVWDGVKKIYKIFLGKVLK
jgi:phage gpG-like protein